MIIDVSLSAIIYGTIAIAAIVLVAHIWQRRSMPGGRYFYLLLVAIAFWAFMCMIEIIAPDPSIVNLMIRLEYISVTAAGPLWLLFVLDYGYRSRWPITVKISWIWVIPIIISILALTNQWHGLIWPRTPVDLEFLGFGLGLWVNIIYTYVLLLAGLVLMLAAAVSSYKQDKRRAVTLLIGSLFPMASSVLYMTGINEELTSAITPLAISATLLIFAWSIFGQRLFELVPVAREVLVQGMIDGMLVLDKDGRLVDQNPAAMKLLGTTAGSLGQHADAVLLKWPWLIDYIGCSGSAPAEVNIGEAESPVWLDVRVSEINDGPGKFYGKLVALRDITYHKLSKEAITRSNESLRAEVVERMQVEKALQAEITIRRQAEERLEISLKEKELLLKEIHHRVKNNLQIISSLLSLQISGNANEDVRASLKESQYRIKSMALIHEQLYQSSDLASIDMKKYVESLIVFWTRSYVVLPGLSIKASIDNISLDIDAAIPCGLIINELISNSLKYAFKDRQSGTIEVSLAKDAGKYSLTVSDDGIGLPPGFDFRKTSSLGMQLVVTLAEQLDGVIERPEGRPGTTFVITFGKGCP